MLKPQRSTRRLIATTALLASSFLFSASAQATSHEDFVTEWTMPVGGLVLTFPGEGAYVLNCGSQGAMLGTAGGSPTCTYTNPGTYTVTATRGITRFNLSNHADAPKLTNVSQWGSAEWSSMEDAFQGASAMQMSASDEPDLSNLTSMVDMFNGVTAFTGNNSMNDWDVSSVENTQRMFQLAAAFNANISGWDVANVTNMNAMFSGAAAFNANIGGWNVANVTAMSNMFENTSTFDQDISSWNIARVTDINSMFAFATAFDQDISSWNVEAVTSMQTMVDTGFPRNLSRWYVVPTTSGAVTTLTAQNATLNGHFLTYTLPAGLGNNDLFRLSGTTIIPIDPKLAIGTYSLHVSVAGGLDQFGASFFFGINPSVAVISIQTSNPATATDFVTEWNMPTSDLTLTFPSEGNYDINWGDGTTQTITTSNPTHDYIAAGAYKVVASNGITRFNLNNGGDKEKLTDVSQWGSAEWSSMEDAFQGASAMQMSASDEPDLSNLTSMVDMFNGATAFTGNNSMNDWNVSSVENMQRMFQSAAAFNTNIGNWDVSNVTDMSVMFTAAAAFNQDIGGWDVSSVTTMTDMFDDATAFNQNLGRWYVTPRTASTTPPTLTAQNSALIDQSPAYTLLDGDGDTNNNLFTLSSAGALSPSDSAQAVGTYSLRIGTSGATTFGDDNAVAITLEVAVGAGGSTTYAISVPTLAELTAAAAAATAAPATHTINAVAGIAISPITIARIDGAVADFSISPAIANGLSFDAPSATIAGTPTAIAATPVRYTITLSDTVGTTTATVDVTVANTYRSSVMATSTTNADGLTQITLGQSSGADIQATGATITLPSGLSAATISISAEVDATLLPAEQPAETAEDSRRSLVDIAVSGVSNSNPVTICLPHDGIAEPGLYHAATVSAWDLLPSQQVTASLVCGNAIAFSPFAVFGKRQSLATAAEEQIINAVLPQLLRAATKISVDNISQRIDQALAASSRSTPRLTIGSNANLQQLLDNNILTVLQSELDIKQMLNNSSFLIPLNLAGANNKGLSTMTLWGSANYLSLGDDVSGVDWNGEVIGGNIGIDTRLKRNLLAGAALAYSAGDVSYQRDGSANNRANNSSSGSLSNTLFSVHPYMAYKLSQGQLWGSLGIGQGELVIDDKATDASSDTFKSQRDTQLFGLALGGNRQLSSNNNWLSISGTTTLELKGEVSLSNIKLAKSQLSDSQALSIAAHRYRMALAASQQHRLAGGAKGSPSVEMGIRYDAGSGKTGASIELAGNYRYTSPKGLEMQLRAHTLLLHQSNYQEWGLSALIKYQASRSGQGLRLSLQPAWGKTPSNVADRIWQASTITNYANAANDVDSNNKLQLNSELGYGLPGPYGHGLLTPYAGLGINNSEQSYNIGTRWTIDQKSKINLISEHKPSGDSIQLRGDFSF